MTAPASDALRAVLLSLPGHAPPERIDRLWVFPPREIAGRESGLLLLALLPGEELPPDQRRVLTVRYQAERTRARAAPATTVTEQGSAPVDRLPRVVAGVLARLGESAGEDPAEHALGGDPDAWSALLAAYGVAPVDRGNRE